FLAHIGGMDAFAMGLEVAYRLINDAKLPEMKKARYASFDGGDGAAFEKGTLTLDALAELAKKSGEPRQISGKQELYENIVNRYVGLL
ncbi:MAG TPA: xylose isomerase, partial [Spirochaetia bacterium]|nr:xylose isomerase [Spirochaetia bacterium]